MPACSATRHQHHQCLLCCCGIQPSAMHDYHHLCSGDTKLLATLTGEPGWTVLLWRWQQAKVHGHTHLLEHDCAVLDMHPCALLGLDQFSCLHLTSAVLCCAVPQVVLQVHPECPCVGACLSLCDDSLLAVAGLHVVKAYRLDVRTGTAKSSNAVMLVSRLSDAGS